MISDVIGSITNKTQRFTSNLVAKANKFVNKVKSYINDFRENGIKKVGQRIKQAIHDNILVHFKSKESIKQMVTSIKERLNKYSI